MFAGGEHLGLRQPEFIDQAVERARMLISDLTDVARLEADRPLDHADLDLCQRDIGCSDMCVCSRVIRLQCLATGSAHNCVVGFISG